MEQTNYLKLNDWTLSSDWLKREDMSENFRIIDEAFGKQGNVRLFGAKGDGFTDDTAAIQAAMNTVSTISIPSGTYMINGLTPLIPRSNTRIILAPDAILQVITTNSANYMVFDINNKQNIEIIGGQLLGDRTTHTGVGGEQGHGISIRASSNVRVSELKASNFWGDGLYVGAVAVNSVMTTSKNIVFTNLISDNNRRQGLSITGAEDCTFIRCTFSNTKGTSPEAGVDLEPNDSVNAPNRKLTFISCRGFGNAGCALLCDTGDSYDITCIDCIWETTDNWSLWFKGKGHNSFVSCRFNGPCVHMSNSHFESCKFSVDSTTTKSSYALEDDSASESGNSYSNCQFECTDKRFIYLRQGLTEANRKIFRNCRFLMINSGGIGDTTTAIALANLYTFERCRFLYSGTPPATGFQFDNRSTDGVSGKMVDCYVDPVFSYFYNTQGDITVNKVGYLTSISSAPKFIGQMAMVGGVEFVAVGTTATTDWTPATRKKLTNISIGTTSTTIAHGLGYVPTNIQITPKGNAVVWQSATAATSTNIYLTASVSTTADIYVS